MPKHNRFLIKLMYFVNQMLVLRHGRILFLLLSLIYFLVFHLILCNISAIIRYPKIESPDKFGKVTSGTGGINVTLNNYTADDYKGYASHQRYKIDTDTVFQNTDAYFENQRQLQNYDCNKLILDDQLEHRKHLLTHVTTTWRRHNLDCVTYRRKIGFIENTLTQTEMESPIAYSILIYKDMPQVLQLLRAIYRPQNFYCLHIDIKCTTCLHQLKMLLKCFDNIFVASERLNVTWGKFSVLQADILCMRDLWNRSSKWKYFINLTGQEFPLKTNFQIVEYLIRLKGASFVKAIFKRKRYLRRWEMAAKPPHGIQPVKGSIHVILNREFVDYILHYQVAIDFLDWCSSEFVRFPDELFFSSLYYNRHLHIPGRSGNSKLDVYEIKRIVKARLKLWLVGKQRGGQCAFGKVDKNICIFNSTALPFLTDTTRNKLFVNKLHWNYSSPVINCLGEWLYNKTRYLENV